MRLLRSLTCALVLGCIIVSMAHAAESTIFPKIDAALESGRIDAQEALLAKIAAEVSEVCAGFPPPGIVK